jgi:membrane protease YdiL (CAAX protease family)
MSNNFFTESLRQSMGMRVFLFLFILLISTLIGISLAAVFVFAGDIGIKIGQGISSVFMFIVPPIVYYYLTRKEHRMHALGFRSLTPPWWLILTGVALMFISLPVTNQLTTWNEGMSFGEGLTWLEDWIKSLEETAKAATEKMLNVDTIGGLLLNLVVVALIPAVGEEMTFRGVLQQSLTRKMNPHVAIVLSAAIFSFIHFQFYGFLPRMFLGLLLGYMFYITGSLWTSMLMHFLNNGTAVVLYFLNNRGVIHVDVEHFGALDNIWLVAASALVTVGLIVWSWWRAKQ